MPRRAAVKGQLELDEAVAVQVAECHADIHPSVKTKAAKIETKES